MEIATYSVLVNGYTVTYKKIGKGEPLILVHGVSGSTKWWKNNIDALSRKYELFLIDLPGYGSMRRFPKRVILKESAVWLSDWIKAVGIKSAHFIGHSMGGYICLQLALASPKSVRSLVLVSPAGIVSNKSMFLHLLGLLRAARFLNLGFLPILLLDALRAGPQILIRSSFEIIAQEIKDDIQHISIPLLLIWGKNDTLVPPTIGKIMTSLLPHAILRVIDNAGHVPMFDKPKEFNEAVLSFLAKKKDHKIIH